MMKQLSNILIIGLLLTGLMSSCDSFLDKTPDNRLRLDTYEKVAELVTNAYPNASGIFMEWMSDNVGPDSKNLQRDEITQAYTWQNVTQEYQDTPSFYWSSNYEAIAHANQALLALEEVKENNPEYKNAIRGEALACRAFAHFMLVNLFAKSYDPQTAATDPGIVIMENPEVTLLANYQRSTVKEVYDFIEKDLLEAINLVSDRYYKNSGKYHFNKNAVLAFASRFFLFKQDYESSAKYATMLLGDGYNSRMIRDYSQLYTGTTSEIIARKFTDPTLLPNLLLVRKDIFYAYKAYAGYRFNQDIYDNLVISKKDQRFSVTYGFSGTTTFLPKFERELIHRASVTASSGFPYTVEVALRAEEVFFNRLEAWVRLDINKTQFESQFNSYLKGVYAGTIDYSTLSKSYKSTFPTMGDKELRLRMVLDEKRREFIEEGIRWFDICRNHLSVIHKDVSGATYVLTENDPRKVIQIPETAIKIGGLQPNDRDNTNEPQPRQINRN
jgi:hypothetical protein